MEVPIINVKVDHQIVIAMSIKIRYTPPFKFAVKLILDEITIKAILIRSTLNIHKYIIYANYAWIYFLQQKWLIYGYYINYTKTNLNVDKTNYKHVFQWYI